MNEQQKLVQLLEKYFGIKSAIWDGEESFDATHMTTIHEDKTETVTNKGKFKVHNLYDGVNNRYKLAEWNEFGEDEELVQFMKDVEYDTVKDYEKIEPNLPINGYTLYKLIPYTVAGEPQW